MSNRTKTDRPDVDSNHSLLEIKNKKHQKLILEDKPERSLHETLNAMTRRRENYMQ